MKYVRQFFIILLVSLAGEPLHRLPPAPIPASVYGLVLLFLCLEFKAIRVEAIAELSSFFLVLLPLTLVPLTVGLIDSLEVLQKVLVPALILGVLGTILTSLAAGGAAEWAVRRRERRGK